MRLLIAEDELEIARVLKTVLERQSYGVDTVTNGADALDYILSGDYDGVILDLMMPRMDGLTVLRRLRAEGNATPVLVLTARSEVSDRVEGLDAGADDFLPKPFAITELLARVRALLRRRDSYVPQVLTLGNLSLDCGRCQIYNEKGERLQLGSKEFQLLECLMRNPRRMYSTQELMERIWGWDSDSEINVVWTNITYLRRKLRELGAGVEIRSVRGVGYRMECAGQRGGQHPHRASPVGVLPSPPPAHPETDDSRLRKRREEGKLACPVWKPGPQASGLRTGYTRKLKPSQKKPWPNCKRCGNKWMKYSKFRHGKF